MAKDSETVQIFFLIFSGLLMLILFLFKYLHDSPKLHSILSEPAMTLIVGMTVSFVVSMFFVFKEEQKEDFNGNNNGNNNDEVEQDLANSILSFQTRVFFLALLPPILFNSGYQLQRELFYRHFGPISLFACVGTCISGFCTGALLITMRHFGLFGAAFYPTIMELLTFGALIAATDTVSVVGILQAKQVDPHLFSLVFGESALNDAVAIVLFKTLSTFLIQDAFGDSSTLLAATIKFLAHLLVQAVCSPLLGMLYAFCLAFALKTVDLREHKMLELALYIMPMYIPYMLAESLELSGMIAIFFTGMFAKRYMEPNVSDSTKQHAEMLFKLFAFLAETCIFLELGLSVFGLSGKFQWPFIVCALVTALIGRATSIYPLAAIYNLSLTKVVMVCTSCTVMDDTSISTLDSQSVQSSLASYQTASSSGGSSWSSRRETPKKRMDKRIPLNFMHMLTFAGLRGAVAYACARDFPNLYGHRDTFVTATMVIVLFTIVIMGGGTAPLMERLQIRTNVDEKEYMRHWHMQRKLKGRFHRFEYHYIYRLVVRATPTSSSPHNNNKLSPEEEEDANRTIKHSMTPVMGNMGRGDSSVEEAAFDYYSGAAMLEDESSGRYLSGRYYDPGCYPTYTNTVPSASTTSAAHHHFHDPSMESTVHFSNPSTPPRHHNPLVAELARQNNTMMNDDSNVFNRFRDESMGRTRNHTISFDYTAPSPHAPRQYHHQYEQQGHRQQHHQHHHPAAAARVVDNDPIVAARSRDDDQQHSIVQVVSYEGGDDDQSSLGSTHSMQPQHTNSNNHTIHNHNSITDDDDDDGTSPPSSPGGVPPPNMA